MIMIRNLELHHLTTCTLFATVRRQFREMSKNNTYRELITEKEWDRCLDLIRLLDGLESGQVNAQSTERERERNRQRTM